MTRPRVNTSIQSARRALHADCDDGAAGGYELDGQGEAAGLPRVVDDDVRRGFR